MFRKLLITSIPLLIVLALLAFKKVNQENALSIEFKLLNHYSKIESAIQFKAIVTLRNSHHTPFNVSPHFQYGWDGSDPFTVQAFDLDNNEIKIASDVDYDYLIQSRSISFKIGDSISDTICNEPLFRFRQKGIYKLRILFDPNNINEKGNKMSEQIYYSNWDTLTIK